MPIVTKIEIIPLKIHESSWEKYGEIGRKIVADREGGQKKY